MTTLEERFEILIGGILKQGYGIVDYFLSPNEIKVLTTTLYKRYEQGEFKPAGIGNQQPVVQRTIRGDWIKWLTESDTTPNEGFFLEKIQLFINYLNRTCFLGLHDGEFHYALYPAGTCYKRHLDRFRTDSRRKLSVICYLNPLWQEEDGGQIVLYLPQPDGPEKAIRINPEGGRLLCFESDRLEHEVLPATRDRISLTGWLRTP